MLKRIIAFSDTHGMHASTYLQDWFLDGDNWADIIIFAGDIQYNGYDNGKSFLNWFSSLPCNNRILVFGNHDVNYEEMKNLISYEYTGITLLHNSSVTIENIKIYGTPYTPAFGNWAFMEDEPVLKKIFSKIDKDTDILVTHGPPLGHCDMTKNGVRAGSSSLENILYEKLSKKLQYHIFGHIHEAYGTGYFKRKDDSTIICHNVSVLDEQYRLKNLPTIIYI